MQRLLLVNYVHGIKKINWTDKFTTIPIEVTIKVKEDIRSRYAKYVFLQGKINSVIVGLVLLGLSTDRNDALLPFHILQLVKSLLFLYLKPKKGTPFARSLPMKAIMWSTPRDKKRHKWPPEWTLLSNAYASLCSKTRLPLHGSSKFEWVHFHPVGSQCIKSNLIKILLMKNWKKTFFLS